MSIRKNTIFFYYNSDFILGQTLREEPNTFSPFHLAQWFSNLFEHDPNLYNSNIPGPKP